MKTSLALLLLTSFLHAGDAPYTLHEWGTFTTVSGSDGKLLAGLDKEEEALPSYVYGLSGVAQGTNPDLFTKGIQQRPLLNVRVKMETPVIYFYTEEPFHAEVKVGFNGGTISQWFPARSAGEEEPAFTQLPDGRIDPASVPIDFAKPRTGSIAWDIDVLPSTAQDASQVLRGEETPGWIYPRLTDSALVKTKHGELEKFLFYRGLGNFSLPAVFTATEDGHLQVRNHAAQALPSLMIFQLTEQGAVSTLHHGAVPARAAVNFALSDLKPHDTKTWTRSVFQEMSAMLQSSGLYPKEADAMVQTWWKSYFQRPGLRVFWILPQDTVESILPLKVSPLPKKTVRVLVGRSEILTPNFEAKLLPAFVEAGITGQGNPWSKDRFFVPYAQRVRQLAATHELSIPKTAQVGQ